jgi:hypothetical protein
MASETRQAVDGYGPESSAGRFSALRVDGGPPFNVVSKCKCPLFLASEVSGLVK